MNVQPSVRTNNQVSTSSNNQFSLTRLNTTEKTTRTTQLPRQQGNYEFSYYPE